MNMKRTRLWFKIALQIKVEETEGNGGPTFYLVQTSYHECFYMPTIQGTFLKTFSKYKRTINELQMNYKSIINKL
jgi:hypothetical protein